MFSGRTMVEDGCEPIVHFGERIVRSPDKPVALSCQQTSPSLVSLPTVADARIADGKVCMGVRSIALRTRNTHLALSTYRHTQASLNFEDSGKLIALSHQNGGGISKLSIRQSGFLTKDMRKRWQASPFFEW